MYQLQKCYELHVLFSCKVLLQFHETESSKKYIHSIKQFTPCSYFTASCAASTIVSITVRYSLQMQHCSFLTPTKKFLSVILLIVRLNSLHFLLDFLENKRSKDLLSFLFMLLQRSLKNVPQRPL